jgi:hypothetical protein
MRRNGAKRAEAGGCASGYASAPWTDPRMRMCTELRKRACMAGWTPQKLRKRGRTHGVGGIIIRIRIPFFFGYDLDLGSIAYTYNIHGAVRINTSSSFSCFSFVSWCLFPPLPLLHLSLLISLLPSPISRESIQLVFLPLPSSRESVRAQRSTQNTPLLARQGAEAGREGPHELRGRGAEGLHLGGGGS